MKVLHVATRFYPGPGGVERHVREVALRQRKQGIDARVLTSDLFTEIPWARLPRESLESSRTPEGIPVQHHHAYALADDLHYPFLPGLYFDIRRDRPDIVHVHTYGTYQGFSALAGTVLSEIPYVLTAHYHPTWSIWGGAGRKRLRQVYDRHLASYVLEHAARLIVQTREEERLLREVAARLPRVAIVPPGYTPLPPAYEGPKGFGATFGLPGPFLLFVGRLASNKGLDVLLTAFAQLADTYPDLSLVVVGEDGGARSETISRTASLGVEGRVRMMGFIQDERMLASAYREAAMLVLPSEYEAFGLVLLESMAQGRPVVSTSVGGIPEVVEDGKSGLLVPPRDAPALARAIRTLLVDTALAGRMGEFGRTVTVPKYTWEGVVSQLSRIYADVLNPRGAQ